MTHPGSFSGDPAGQQPHRAPGGVESAPPAHRTTPPSGYHTPPPAYSPSPPGTSGGYPPPPAHYGGNTSLPGPYGHPYPSRMPQRAATNGMAIGSLVSSFVGIATGGVCLIGALVMVLLPSSSPFR